MEDQFNSNYEAQNQQRRGGITNQNRSKPPVQNQRGNNEGDQYDNQQQFNQNINRGGNNQFGNMGGQDNNQYNRGGQQNQQNQQNQQFDQNQYDNNGGNNQYNNQGMNNQQNQGMNNQQNQGWNNQGSNQDRNQGGQQDRNQGGNQGANNFRSSRSGGQDNYGVENDDYDDQNNNAPFQNNQQNNFNQNQNQNQNQNYNQDQRNQNMRNQNNNQRNTMNNQANMQNTMNKTKGKTLKKQRTRGIQQQLVQKGWRDQIITEQGKKNNFFQICCTAVKEGVQMNELHYKIHNDNGNGMLHEQQLIQYVNTVSNNQLGSILQKYAFNLFKQPGDDMIYFQDLLERLDKEMVKFNQLIRLFIQIQKRMTKWKCSFEEVIKKYSKITKGKVSADDFFKMAEQLGVLKSKNVQETKHIFEEYNTMDDYKLQQLKQLEADLNNTREDQQVSIDVLDLSEQSNVGKNKPEDEKLNSKKLKEQISELNDLKLFDVREIQEDFNTFDIVYIQQLEAQMIFMLNEQSLNLDLPSILHLFFKTEDIQEENDNANANQDDLNDRDSRGRLQENSQSSLVYTGQINVYTLHNIIQDENWNQLKSIFILKGMKDKKNIPFNYIYSLIQRLNIKTSAFVDDIVNAENEKNMLKHISEVMMENQKSILDYFTKSITIDQVVSKFTNLKGNFDFTKYDLDERLIQMVLLRNYNNKQNLDINFLNQQIEIVNKQQENIYLVLNQFANCLSERRFTLDILFEKIIGLREKEQSIDKAFLQRIFKMIDCNVSTEQFDLTFNSFTQNDPKYIQLLHFIQEIHKIECEKKGATSIKDQRIKSFAMKKQIRKYTQVEDVLKHIGYAISKHQIQMGQILAGYDYNEDNTITKSDFFQTLMAEPMITNNENGIKEGDIMDLMNNFRSEGKYLKLKDIKKQIDLYIKDSKYRLQYVSNVKQICDETIIEQTEKKSNKKTIKNNEPKQLANVALDVFCGCLVNEVENYLDHLSSHTITGFSIDKTEFMRSMESLNITQDNTQVFQYLVRLQGNGTETVNCQLINKVMEDQINSPHRDFETLLGIILQNIIVRHQKHKSAIADIFQKHRDQNMNGFYVRKEVFKKTLVNEIHMKNVTNNQLQMLLHYYEDNEENQDVLNINTFIEDLETALNKYNYRKETNFILCLFQNDVQSSKQETQISRSIKSKTGSFKEPIYVRNTKQNTFLTFEEKKSKPSRHLNSQSSIASKMVDIMLRTKATGNTVEAYFQQYGTLMTHGLTELTSDQFIVAIKGLELSWGEDKKQIDEIYRNLDTDEDSDMRGTLGLDEIGVGILDCVSTSYQYYENEYLEIIYQQINKNNKLKQIKDMMDYLNFNRDYTCSQLQFVQALRKNFEIGNQIVEDWQIQLLAEKYAATNQKETSGKISLKEAQGIKKVQFFSFVSDIGFRCNGIEVGLMKNIDIVDRMVKQIQIQQYDYENNVDFDQLFYDIVNRSQVISSTQLKKFSSNYGFESFMNEDQLDQFLEDVGVLAAADGDEQQQLAGEYYFNLNALVNTFEKLNCKSMEQKQQDTLNKIYIESKQQGLSHTMMTVFSEVDGDDGVIDGFITEDQFIESFNKLNFRQIKGVDIRYLSNKYNQDGNIYYEYFYKDYEYMEANGLSRKVYGLNIDLDKTKSKQNQEDLNPFKFEIPEKFLKFYEQCKEWLTDRKLSEKLVITLLRKDRKRTGFVTDYDIQDSLKSVGMSLKNKQIGQLTYALHQNVYGSFSYPELIQYIFGQQFWTKMKNMHGLEGLKSMIEGQNKQKVEYYSEYLKWMCEYMHDDMIQEQKKMTNNFNKLSLQQVFEIFNKAGIIMSKSDTNKMNQYLEEITEKNNGIISLNEVFQQIEVTTICVEPKKRIHQFMSENTNREKAFDLFLQKQYQFDDIISHLLKMGFDMNLLRSDPGSSGRNVLPQNYKTEYQSLYVMYVAAKEMAPIANQTGSQAISKIELYKMLNIKKVEQIKEPISSPQQKVEVKKESEVEKKVKKDIPMKFQLKTVELLRTHINQNIYRKKPFQEIDQHRITGQQLLDVLKSFHFEKAEKRLEALVQFFESTVQVGKDGQPDIKIADEQPKDETEEKEYDVLKILISMKKLKKEFKIRKEEPKKIAQPEEQDKKESILIKKDEKEAEKIEGDSPKKSVKFFKEDAEKEEQKKIEMPVSQVQEQEPKQPIIEKQEISSPKPKTQDLTTISTTKKDEEKKVVNATESPVTLKKSSESPEKVSEKSTEKKVDSTEVKKDEKIESKKEEVVTKPESKIETPPKSPIDSKDVKQAESKEAVVASISPSK